MDNPIMHCSIERIEVFQVTEAEMLSQNPPPRQSRPLVIVSAKQLCGEPQLTAAYSPTL